jgi:hypothetical protein
MRTTDQSGLIKMILIILLAVALLGYFGISVRKFFDSPTVRDNVLYTWNLMVHVWTVYLKEPAFAVGRFLWSLVQPGLEMLRQ